MGDEALLRAGEVVLLVDLRRGKRHLVTLRLGQAFHSDRGFIPHDTLVGLPEGVVAVTTRGARYLALRPTLAEYVLEMPRGAQIIYPKDLATIALFADIGPGQTVVEAGLGSGALTLVLLRLVGPAGRVVSYEMREEFARRAQRNIEARLGPAVPLTVRPQDIYLGIEEREVDRLVLDLPEPWRLVEPAAVAAPPGRRLLRLRPHHPPVPAGPRGARRAPGVRARRDVRDPPPALEHRRPLRPAGPPHGRAHRLSHPGPPGPAGRRRQRGAAARPRRPTRTPTRRSAPTPRGRDAGELLQAEGARHDRRDGGAWRG